MTTMPPFFRIRQQFDTSPSPATGIENIHDSVQRELEKLDLASDFEPGATIAITAGSRGISNIAEILRAISLHLKALNAQPFIVPAMGSHGGGTAAGQRKVLESYGITESYCECPIRSSMDTVEVCQAAEGFPVHFDRHAAEADHVLVCGRIKPHTSFVGPIESGLMKMMLIGLGKHEGAKIYHRAIKNFSFDQIVRSVGREVIARCNILAGLAIVENQYDQTAILEAVRPAQIETREPQLLQQAKQLIPSIPVRNIDLLIVDEIGKNISGTGMDTNVIGRKYNDHVAAEDEYPKVKRIFVRDLTDATAGNATGIGIAEFCHARVVEKTDHEVTRVNCITGGHPTAAMIPISYSSDREVLGAALATIGLTEPQDARIVWLHNTLDIAELECSQSLAAELSDLANVEICCQPRQIEFDKTGNLPRMKRLRIPS